MFHETLDIKDRASLIHNSVFGDFVLVFINIDRLTFLVLNNYNFFLTEMFCSSYDSHHNFYFLSNSDELNLKENLLKTEVLWIYLVN